MATQDLRINVKCRLSYANLFEPVSRVKDGPKIWYGVTCLVPKTDTETVALIKKTIEEAKKLGKTEKWNGKIPSNLKVRFNDCDDPENADHIEKNPAYAGHYYFSCHTKNKPGVVDRAKNPVSDSNIVYSGCYGVVSISFFPYNTEGNGISFGLNNVMKLRDGEKFGAARSADEDFKDFEIEDEEEDFLS